MKQFLLFSLGLLLCSLTGYAQFTRTYTGALTSTDPTIAGDRLYRDGTTAACGATKTYPGTSLGASGVLYDSYIVANPSTTASVCVTLTLTHGCTEAITPLIFLSVYQNTFVPTNLSTNYKSDAGSSPSSTATATMAVTLAPSETITMVVSGLTSAALCSAYSLTVAAPTALPVKTSQNIDAVLNAYPNPVADVLHIEAAKSGTYTLYSLMGQVVKNITSSEVSLADLPSGVYLLQQAETKVTTRIVKL